MINLKIENIWDYSYNTPVSHLNFDILKWRERGKIIFHEMSWICVELENVTYWGFFCVCVEIMKKILNVVLFKDSRVLSEAIKTQSFIEG